MRCQENEIYEDPPEGMHFFFKVAGPPRSDVVIPKVGVGHGMVATTG